MAHLISDESIGGIIREYIEAGREVNVGDYVYLVNVEDIREVSEASVDDINEQIQEGHIKTLTPTNIVIIEGQRYRLTERKAEVGEKVIVTKQFFTRIPGEIHLVIDGEEFGFDDNDGQVYIEASTNTFDRIGRIEDEYYSVLIPVDSEPAEPTPDIHDLIANLAQRVTSLERITGELVRAKSSVENKLGSIESQLLDAQRNIERLAQDHELVKFKVVRLVQSYDSILDEVESNTKDIAFLDDRTFEKPGKPLTEIMKLSVTRFDGGEKHVEVSYLGDPTPEEVGKAITQAMKGGIK